MTFYIKETCPKRGYWCSVRLVDEHGSSAPYAGLGYTFHDRMGESYSGYLDDEGYARIENFYCGPLVLDLSMPYQGLVDPWYDELQIRKHFKIPLTALQVAAEQPPSGPRDNGKTYLAKQRAENEKAVFYQVEVRDFVKPDAAAHLPEADTTLSSRPSAYLKEVCGQSNQRPGIALMANEHTLLEIKALRAYSPLLSRDKAFCALNAYHLSLMSVLSYAPFHTARAHDAQPTPPPYQVPGCIASVLHNHFAHCIKPTQFNDAGPYSMLCEEVPYSKRLEVMPYDIKRYEREAKSGWEYPEQVHFLHDESDTQAFITHNDKVVLISVRGTQGKKDILRDMDARQLPYLKDEGGTGQAHRGFYESFEIARKFIERYMDAFYTGTQTIMVCGHSLGGAIALLVAEWLRRSPDKPNVILYTIGSPRAGDRSFVKAAADLTHHRIVNHNDVVPALPTPWMDAEWKAVLPGTTMLVASIGSPFVGLGLLLGGLLNLRGDSFKHHGEQWHYMPRKKNADGYSSILWQPGCAAIEEQACAKFAGDIDLKGDMPQRSLTLDSGKEHSSHNGYTRAALTTLLRWHSSVTHREGDLFTDDERKKLRGQIEPLREDMSNPIELSYNQFRHDLRTRAHPRLEKMSEVELRISFDEGLARIEELRKEQKKSLSRAQKRLLAQGERVLTWQDVFGDLPQSDAIVELINEWLEHPENKQAARLAKVSKPNDQQQAWV